MSRIRALSVLLLAAALLAMPTSSQAQMIVSLPYSDALYLEVYDATTGAYQFFDPISGVAIGEDVLYGPDGTFYVGTGSNVIVSADYDGSAYPANLAQFNQGDSGVLSGPRGMAWAVINGQDKFYVSSVNNGQVLRYSSGGNYEGLIFGPGSFLAPYGLAVGNGKELYIANYNNIASNIYKIDGDTGASLDDPDDGDSVFAQLTLESPSGLEWWPLGIAIGPNGDIYLSAAPEDPGPGTNAQFTGGAIFRITAGPMSDGTVVASYKDAAGAVLNYPQDMVFGADGKLYVANANDGVDVNAKGNVQRFTADLTPDGTFISGDPFDSPFSHLTFVPTACTDGVDNDGDGLVDLGDPGCLAATDPSENDAAFPCDDGVDNDGDGNTDFPTDLGCDSRTDTSERSPTWPCDDGIDNDGDGRTDFDPVTAANPGSETTAPGGNGDPGCGNPTWGLENPQCNNGVNDDGQVGIDYDGGAFLNGGTPIDVKDPQCGKPWRNKEKAGCGASILPITTVNGPALAALLLLLAFVKPNPRRRRTFESKH